MEVNKIGVRENDELSDRNVSKEQLLAGKDNTVSQYFLLWNNFA